MKRHAFFMRHLLIMLVVLSAAGPRDEAWRRMRAVLERAFQLAGRSPQEIQYAMDLAQPQFSKQLGGAEHFSLRRFAAVDEETLRCFGVAIVLEYGLPTLLTDGTRLVQAVETVRPRMAKMALPSAAAESERSA